MTGEAHVVGLVVIGRNEGERLRRCLEALGPRSAETVYVDSGSTDGSVALAESMGVAVARLDMTHPFTAGRARNAGFERLRGSLPNLCFVQFVDGDCELIDGWLDAATDHLCREPGVAIACGRLRESFPERSVYNRLCDQEWNRPPGESDACGGIFMIRASLFASLGGFREDLLAGEEPELCSRVRARGGKIWRLDRPMAWHDAAMLHFGQWWTRSRRIGFGYAQGASVSRSRVERHRLGQLLRPWFWALVLPLAVLGACVAWGTAGLLLLAIYPLQIARLTRSIEGDARARWSRAIFLMVGKWPELLGELEFLLLRRRHHGAGSFDYKS